MSPPLALVQALLKQSAANTAVSYRMDNDYEELNQSQRHTDRDGRVLCFDLYSGNAQFDFWFEHWLY